MCRVKGNPRSSGILNPVEIGSYGSPRLCCPLLSRSSQRSGIAIGLGHLKRSALTTEANKVIKTGTIANIQILMICALQSSVRCRWKVFPTPVLPSG